jgi:hypothetical protein
MQNILENLKYQIWYFSDGKFFNHKFANAVFEYEDYRGRVYSFCIPSKLGYYGCLCRYADRKSPREWKFIDIEQRCIRLRLEPPNEMRFAPEYVADVIEPYKEAYPQILRLLIEGRNIDEAIKEAKESLNLAAGIKREFYEAELKKLELQRTEVISQIDEFEIQIGAAFAAIEELRASIEFVKPEGYTIEPTLDGLDLRNLAESTALISKIKVVPEAIQSAAIDSDRTTKADA